MKDQKKTLRGKSHSNEFVLDVDLPWKSKESVITISKVSSNVRDEFIQIHIQSRKEKVHFIANLTPENFGLAITGLGHLPCDFIIE
jgi:hypothetical protein